MKAWVCNYCHAKNVSEEKPKACQLCYRINRNNFYEIDIDEPSKLEKEYSKIYDDVLKKMEEYSEGCEPETRIGEE
ncbi:MAG: hypothetical protein ABIA93_04395 [Candidatus Woesearchaeota archaeon]